MKKFIFYTKEGYTQDKKLNEVENMQILGFESGKNLQDAYENFKNNNFKYNFDEIIAQEIVGDAIYL